ARGMAEPIKALERIFRTFRGLLVDVGGQQRIHAARDTRGTEPTQQAKPPALLRYRAADFMSQLCPAPPPRYGVVWSALAAFSWWCSWMAPMMALPACSMNLGRFAAAQS